MRKITFDDFVTRSNITHGNKYEYISSSFTKLTTKTRIVCPNHGEFIQNAKNHTNGDGCPKCSGNHRKTNDEFIDASNIIHSGKYDYSSTNFTTTKSSVTIICPTHGEFSQIAGDHLAGKGCKQCGHGMIDQSTFIKLATEAHAGKYNYDEAEYVNKQHPVKIICPEHGEFTQSAISHLNGSGCQKCNGGVSITHEEFIINARATHGDDYDYSLVEYVNMHTKVTIICPTHGEFIQTPNAHNHLNTGCPKCNGGVVSNVGEFIEKATTIHHNGFDYTLVKYINQNTHVDIKCNTCDGEFSQTPYKHLSGSGCSLCHTGGQRLTTTEFISNAISLHGDKYGYDNVVYLNNTTPVEITCPTHGVFWQTPMCHTRISPSGCPKCVTSGISRAETEFLDQLETRFGDITRNNRNIIDPKELDGYFPEQKLAIEYCGLYWHSELLGKSKKYHLDKLTQCNEQGISLITIFEDEWVSRPEVVINRIGHALGKSTKSIGARQCDVREITKTEATVFLNIHHLQGYSGCRHRFGLFRDNQLVSVMTFSVPSLAKGFTGDKTDIYEISRFASSINVSGGGSKLLKAFERIYEPREIFTYADLRWGDGSSYLKMGFEFVHDSPPNYWYFKGQKRYHRFALRKTPEDDQSLTEWENRQLQGWNRIWDCGHRKFRKYYSNGP